MHISFSPQYRNGTLTVSKSGHILTVNGEPIDFSIIPDGATLPAEAIDSEWVVGSVERIDGVLHITLLLPFGVLPPEPWQAFPEPITVTSDGPIDVPCDTVVTVDHIPAVGGTNIVTTTKRWRQEPDIVTEFMPDPEPEPEDDHDDT